MPARMTLILNDDDFDAIQEEIARRMGEIPDPGGSNLEGACIAAALRDYADIRELIVDEDMPGEAGS